MAKDSTAVVEPPVDPNRPARPVVKKTGAPIEGLPRTKSTPPKPKVSERFDWSVIAKLNGYEYGPFVVNAVDESEAITRLLDGPEGLQLKPHVLHLRYEITKVQPKAGA